MAADSELNPYASPLPVPEQRVTTHGDSARRLRIFAWSFVAFAILCGLTYTYVDEVVIKTKIGAWPLLCFSAGVSLVSAVVTRRAWLAALSCILGTLAGDLLAGILVSWGYAQVKECVLLSIGFSFPAFIVASVLEAKRNKDR